MLQRHIRRKPTPILTEDDEFDIISKTVMDYEMVGERCLKERHDTIIEKQKVAIVSLRDTITALEEETSASANIPGFAMQRISTLKKENEALEQKLAREIIATKRNLLDVADQKLYNEVCRLTELLEFNKRQLKDETKMRREIQDDLHKSEEIHFKCMRDLNSELEIKHKLGFVPLVDGCDRNSVIRERHKGIEVVMNNIKSLKARVRRQDELLGSYDTDMKNLRDLESKYNKITIHVKYIESELEEKGDELTYLHEALKKARGENADLKRLNTATKLNKKFSMDFKEK